MGLVSCHLPGASIFEVDLYVLENLFTLDIVVTLENPFLSFMEMNTYLDCQPLQYGMNVQRFTHC